MSWIRVLLWLLPRRLRSSWGLVAVTSFGVLAAVTLMAVGAIYSRALAEGGLRHTLASTSPTVLNAWVTVQNRPLGPSDYQRLRPTIEEIAQRRVGYMLWDTQRFGRSQPNLPLVMTLDGSTPAFDAPLGRPFFVTNFEAHARILKGRWPQAAPVLHDKGLDMEVVVGQRVASSMGLKVGSQMYLIPFRADPSERITLTVMGVAEPIDPHEEYWMGLSSAYFSMQDYNERLLVPIYIPEETFFGGLGARYPSMVGDYGWLFFLDTSILTASKVKPTRDAIIGLETDINKRFPRSLVLSGLKNTLADYQRDLTLARVPLFLFISLVVVVILYFLSLTMGAVARTRSDEASLLRSRGASMLQVSGLLALGEGMVVLLAMALGPFLALGIVRYLLMKTINPAGEGGALSVGLSADMFVMGAIGGILSLGALMASGVGLARLGMVEFLRIRARPPAVPILQRYYVDLLVLAGVGLVWWQIYNRGGFVERDVSSGALEWDKSLVFGPVLALLAAAFLVLRLLPLLVKAAAWAASLLAPAWVSFTLVRVARDPMPHSSLAIILMMAAALGVFGATFQASLSRSQREQALYDTGGDLVISAHAFSYSVQDNLADTPGVEAVSPISRESVTLLDGFPGSSTALVAVDPYTLPYTTWFRDDFSPAGKGIRDLLKALDPSQADGGMTPGDGRGSIPLPVDAESVGIWVKANSPNQGGFQQKLNLWMRLSDAEGRYRTLFLGDLSSTPSPSQGGRGEADKGWAYLEAQLPADQAGVKPPFSLVSIFFSVGSLARLQPGSISLDDVTVKKAEGKDSIPSTALRAGPSISSISSPRPPTTNPNPAGGIVVEGFEEPGSWVPLPNSGPDPDLVTQGRSPQAAHSGLGGLTFFWQGEGGTQRGILIPPGPFPLPAIGGPGFYVGQELRIKSGKQAVPLVVKEVTDYFPTIYPSSQTFLLVSLEDYKQYNERIGEGILKSPAEFWVSVDETGQRGQTILSVKERLPIFALVRDRDAAVDLAQRDPLSGGGWNGLTILSISALTVVVVLALGTYAAVLVYTGRVDLTVVRALGLTGRQLLLSLTLERVVVAVLGIAAGSAIGIWLGRWVLGFLDITSTGHPVVPPMIVTVNASLIALVIVDLVAAIAVAILFASLSASRLRASDILRTGG